MKEGIKKTSLSFFSSLLSPISLILPIVIGFKSILGKYLENGHEMKIFWRVYELKFIDNILKFIIARKF